jgi:hypothetical protein
MDHPSIQCYAIDSGLSVFGAAHESWGFPVQQGDHSHTIAGDDVVKVIKKK